MSTRPRAKLGLGAVLVSLLLTAGLPVLSPAEAADPVVSAWYFRAQQAGAPSVAAASGIPAGEYAVSYIGSLAQARTALALTVGSASSGNLVLHIDAAASTMPAEAHVLACPSDAGWKVEEAGPWADQPLFSCGPESLGRYDAVTSTVTVPLASLLELAAGGSLQLILTPQEDPEPNANLAPTPKDPQAPSWTVAIDRISLVGLASTPGHGTTEPPVFVAPPVPLPPTVQPTGDAIVPGLPGTGLPGTVVPGVTPEQPPALVASPPPTTTQVQPVGDGRSTTTWWNPSRWPLAVFLSLALLGGYVPRRARQLSVLAARQQMSALGEHGSALRVTNLHVTFGGIRAVQGVSFDIPRGQVVGLIGPNGAGKTTVLDAITRTVDSTGRVALFGADVSSLDTSRRAQLGLGRSFQDGRLFPSLTVRECLAVACEQSSPHVGPLAGALGAGTSAHNERQLAVRTDELIELMGLTAYGDKFVSELSTGSRRIVDLAAMIAHGARLLLLDEPSSGIAQKETEALGPVLLRLREQLDCTIVIIEHDMPLLRAVADRLIAFEVGQVIADGTPDEVLHDPVVVEAYLGTDSAAVNRSGSGGASTKLVTA